MPRELIGINVRKRLTVVLCTFFVSFIYSYAYARDTRGPICADYCDEGRIQCNEADDEMARDVRQMVEDIIQVREIDPRILGRMRVSRCSYANNAAAALNRKKINLPEIEFFMFYNRVWVQETHGSNNMAFRWLIAHEFAHIHLGHLSGPTEKPTLTWETQADEFAGCTIGLMRGRWSQIQDVVERLRVINPDDYPNATVTRNALYRCSSVPKCFDWNGEEICD